MADVEVGEAVVNADGTHEGTGLAYGIFLGKVAARDLSLDAFIAGGGPEPTVDETVFQLVLLARESNEAAEAMAEVLDEAYSAGGGGGGYDEGFGISIGDGSIAVDTSVIATKTFASDEAAAALSSAEAYADGVGFTVEKAQDAVGGAMTDSARIDVDYNDVAGTITLDLVAGSVSNGYLANMAANRVMGRASGSGSPQHLTGTQVTAMLDEADGSTPGLMPAAHYEAVDDLIAGVVTPRALSLTTTFAVAANHGVIVPQRYTVGSGGSLRIGAGAVFEVS